MPRSNRSARKLYTEREAAAALRTTVAHLHEVLDRHIFTDGNPRPQCIQFTSDDLLLLGYWCGNQRDSSREVITMPKRG